MASSCASDIRSVTGVMVASISRGIKLATIAHVADRIGDRRGHQRRPAPDLPARVDIGEKLFTQLVA